MIYPGYQSRGSRPQRRATQSSSSPQAQGYPPYPGYAARGGYEYQQSMPYPPTAYVPNPLLAAYALPPPLPRLVNSRAKRPTQPRETYLPQIFRDRGEESPPPTAREHRHFRRRYSGSDDRDVPDDARWDSGSDDRDVPDDDHEFSDSGDIALDSQGVRLHSAEPSPYVDTVERILHSRFHGSNLDQDVVTAHLITEPQSKGSPSDIPNLFEWIHLETTTQSFASFMSHVSNLLRGTRYKPDQVSLLLNEVRRKFEHQIPTSGNTKGKYLEPTVASTDPSSSHQKGNTSSRIQFLCIPYFHLKPLPTHRFSVTSDIHPIRTLLQIQHPSTSAKRDMQQAVCQLDYTRKRHCFHVPQLWCLMIDNGFLITSGPMSENETQQQVADLTVDSAADAISRYLHVADASGRRWLLPLSDCQSWTEFIAHFSDMGQHLDQPIDVIYKHSIQGPKDWANIMATARKQIVRLRIRPLRRRLKSRHRNGPRRRSSLGDQIHRSFSEMEPDSSSSGARPPEFDGTIREQDDTFSDTFSDAVARPLPVTIGSKEVDPKSPNITEKRFMNPQDHMPSEGQKKRSSTQTSPRGSNTIMSVSRQPFHLYYWLSAAPALSTEPTMSEKEAPSAATNSVSEHNTTTFDVDSTKINKYIIELTVHMEQLSNPVSVEKSLNSETRQYPVNCVPRRLTEVQTKLAELKKSCENATHSQGRQAADSFGRRPQARVEDSSDVQGLSASCWSVRSPKQSQSMRCQGIFHLAKQVYQFLLPLSSSSIESWGATKFWGAIYWYIENPEAEGTRCILDYASRYDLKDKLCAVAEDLQYGPHPGTISLPDEFRQVGHLLIAIFLEGTCAKPRKKLSSRFFKCQNLLSEGRRIFLQLMAPEGLETMEAVLPVGLVALLVNKVVKDITDDAPDIVSTYYDYMLRLEQDIQKRPHRRLHQEKLSSFRQETNCIIRVLEDQIGVVKQLQQMLDKGGVIDLILGRRREDFILGECLTTLEDRVSNFNSLERHARDLASFNLLRIESSKDRQEAAILVFTIVTIIFLPLSFVSSFFGMNTTDIRDTKFPQWIFWVSAVPLTVLVVILSLFVAQQLEPLKDLWGRVQDRWIALAHRESRVEYNTHRRPTGELQADGEYVERPNLPASRVRISEESNGI